MTETRTTTTPQLRGFVGLPATWDAGWLVAVRLVGFCGLPCDRPCTLPTPKLEEAPR